MEFLDVLVPRAPRKEELEQGKKLEKPTLHVVVRKTPELAPYLMWSLMHGRPTSKGPAQKMLDMPLGLLASMQVELAQDEPDEYRQHLAEEYFRRYVADRKQYEYVPPEPIPGVPPLPRSRWPKPPIDLPEAKKERILSDLTSARFEGSFPSKVNKFFHEWWAEVQEDGSARFGAGWWAKFQPSAAKAYINLFRLVAENTNLAEDVWADIAEAVFEHEALRELVTNKLAAVPGGGTPYTTHDLHSEPIKLEESTGDWRQHLHSMRGRNEVRALLLLERKHGVAGKRRFPVIAALRQAPIPLGYRLTVTAQAVPGRRYPLRDVLPRVLQGDVKFLEFVAHEVMLVLAELHQARIGHHRVGVDAFEFVLTKPGEAMSELLVNRHKSGYLVATDFTAARYYPQILEPGAFEEGGKPVKPRKRPKTSDALVPSMAMMPSAITCRSFPDMKRAAEEGARDDEVKEPEEATPPWPSPPELSLDEPHVSRTKPPTEEPSFLNPLVIPEMGMKTDIWDAAIMLARHVFKLQPPTFRVTAATTDEDLAAWLEGVAPKPVAKTLKAMLKMKPEDRIAASKAGFKAAYDMGAARVGGALSDDEDEREGAWQWDGDLLLPCPDSLCHPVYADHQRLVRTNRQLKAELRRVADTVREALALVVQMTE